MSTSPGVVSRGQLAVAWALALLVAPVAVQGGTKVLAAWTGEPHAALPLTLGALAPALVAGVGALVRGRPVVLLAWLVAALVGATLAATTGAIAVALLAAVLAGVVAGPGFAWVAARAPVPRGKAAVLWGMLAVLSVAQFTRMSVFMADPEQRWGALAPVDFIARHSCLTSYIQGAELARRGDANIYDDRYGNAETMTAPELAPVIATGPLTIDTYEYPPSFLPLPRAMLAIVDDFLAIRALWYALTAAAFVWGVAVLARWLGGDAQRRALLMGLPLVLTPAVLLTLHFGNFQLSAMGLSAVAMVWICRGDTRRGAALLAFTAGAKIFPGILIVYLLATRRLAAVAWTAVFGALYALLALALFGARPFADFFGYHLPRLASGETFAFLTGENPTASNLAVFGLPFKLRALGVAISEPEAWALAARLSWVYSLIVVALAVVAGLRARTRDGSAPRSRAAEAGVWFGLLALAALRSPFSPPAVLIPVFWGLSLRAATLETRRGVALLAALWVALYLFVPNTTPAVMLVMLVNQALIYATAIALVLPRRTAAT